MAYKMMSGTAWILSASIVVLLLASSLTIADGAAKKVYRVTSIISNPFLLENSSSSVNLTGNDRYVGYIKDLLDALADVGNFEYAINLVKDHRYGAKESSGWNGMIGELVRGEADMAAAPLIVTLPRETAVDFTYPIFRFEAMAVMAKRGENQEPKIESFEDVLAQEDVKYGTLKNGAIAKSLKDSANPEHKKMWENLEENADELYRVNDNAGVEDARVDYNYAYIMEGTRAEWLANTPPCDLQILPTGIFKRQYALALADGSADREKINEYIVELQSNNVLNELRDKWWGGDACSATSRAVVSLTLLWGLAALLIHMMISS